MKLKMQKINLFRTGVVSFGFRNKVWSLELGVIMYLEKNRINFELMFLWCETLIYLSSKSKHGRRYVRNIFAFPQVRRLKHIKGFYSVRFYSFCKTAEKNWIRNIDWESSFSLFTYSHFRAF